MNNLLINNLINFEGKDINYIIGADGEPLFELYSVGRALGYERVTVSKGKEYIQARKDRIDKIVESAEITGLDLGGTTYLTEEMLYDFIFEARTEKCKAFRKWVTNEVLPTIRKDGAYVSPNITAEQENNLTRYGLPNRRKDLFLNIPVEQIAEAYRECMEYNSKKAAPERVKIEKEIVATLSNRVDTALENKNAALALVVQTEISKIQKKLTERSNRSYGARLGNANKKLNMVTKQLEEAQEYILDIEPTQDEYNCLNIHGFTINRQYAPNVTEYGVLRTDFKKNPRFVKTEAYSR